MSPIELTYIFPISTLDFQLFVVYLRETEKERLLKNDKFTVI